MTGWSPRASLCCRNIEYLQVCNLDSGSDGVSPTREKVFATPMLKRAPDEQVRISAAVLHATDITRRSTTEYNNPRALAAHAIRNGEKRVLLFNPPKNDAWDAPPRPAFETIVTP